ncbi:16S rRNA (cytidine(1402)-2'-O)-methyltransferase [Candidatus Marinimicrobia bacterium]|nr:16S rRNA (cytidine(1402)-2'-O)-methyltransferase [Candidatus Neomarinimicrobiota bacterium]
MLGKLYTISTPIGNLSDFSFRAIEILNEIDYLICEDTRVTKKLLNHYKIKSTLLPYNVFNENKLTDKYIKHLTDGKNMGIVSDAGTPCISDPGYKLVNNCRQLNIEVISIPGPSSLISALSISGLPTDSFYFEGFLPKKKGRKTKFEFLSSIPSTVVLFESPYRLLKTVNDILSFMGNRQICICKELTKVYEEVIFGCVTDILILLSKIDKLKGEYVIIIAKKGYELK